ncbi:hypothetical protein SAY86_021821 [Trapa natans]|uniref:Uncharacterized protein n=1 Tax=Trapa natans TaxID=22666 RepID=A0AAN7RDB7_TRANT|nr:hypothetical protein SAY86_021821 [Trapa natans]
MAGVSESSWLLTAPSFSPQKDGKFASNGRLTMLVLVITFGSFFLFLIVFLYARRPNLPPDGSYISKESELPQEILWPDGLNRGSSGSRSTSQLPRELEG